MTADEIVAAARSELGTPFQHQGRIAGRALDCVGLCAVVARRWHEPVEPSGYGRLPHGDLIEHWMSLQPYLEQSTRAEAGDILLMRFRKFPQHLAVCAGETIIHCYSAVGRVVEHRVDARWASRIVQAYRFVDKT